MPRKSEHLLRGERPKPKGRNGPLDTSQPAPSPGTTKRNTEHSKPTNAYTDKKAAPSPYCQTSAQANPTQQLESAASNHGNRAEGKDFKRMNISELQALFNFGLVIVGALQIWLLIIVFNNDRPVVIVARLTDNDSPPQAFRPTIILRNGGTKPAVRIRAVGQIRPNEALPYKLPDKPRYSELLSCTMDRPAIGIGEETQISCGTFLLQNESEVIPYVVGEKNFAVYGVVYYRRTSGLWRRTYQTYFYWFYSPRGQITPEGRFYPGPEEYNRQT